MTNLLDYSVAKIQLISAHYIGNKFNHGELVLSKQPIHFSDDPQIKAYLSTLFLSHFNQVETHRYTFSNGNPALNPLYQLTNQLFQNPDSFHLVSISLAKQLFSVSDHPNIKEGEFFIAYISDLAWGDEMVNAISLIKVENKSAFINWNGQDLLEFFEGIAVAKVDKGCLILNTEAENGFRLRIIDQRNKNQEAQFWKEKYLVAEPVMDEYQYTQGYLQLTKSFIETELADQIGTPKTDQVGMMNRSYAYFKTKEEFDVNEFTQEVFSDIKTIQSYGDFVQEQTEISGKSLSGTFPISQPAVKKQARAYRSVIKLDRNFHIYVHGDERLIEKGTDSNGHKYYKLYFTEES